MFSKKVVDPRLVNIEVAGGLDGGLAALLLQSLRNYDDAMLRAELSGAGQEISDVGGITEQLFIDIALSASKGYITVHEAKEMFRRGQQAMDCVTAHGSQKQSSSLTGQIPSSGVSPPPPEFAVLLKALFKKLLVLHLTRDVCSHRLLVSSSNKSLDFYRSRSIEEPTPKNKGRKQKIPKQKLRSTTPLSSLRNELAASGLVQQRLDKKIAGNLTLLSQTVSLGDRTSAVAFSKQVGTRKVEVVLHKKLNRYFTLYFQKWKATYKSVNAEIFCVRFLRLYGATKVWEYAVKQVGNKRLRYLRKWYTISLSMQRADLNKSVVLAQRVIRGGLGRRRVREIRQHLASITIQKRHRGYLGRLRMENRRAHLRLCAAVAVVERAYQKQIWIRAGNRMRLMLKQDKASRKIQRAQRAHRANVMILKIRRTRLERRAATKIQSQWRRFLHSVYVDDIRRRRVWLDATLVVQRVARGMLGRLYAHDVREMKLSAISIQCSWRSSVARAVVEERRRNFRASEIQRVARGRRGRKYFKRVYNAHHFAYAQIARGVRGYRDRKKYKPILAEYTAKRSAASLVLAKQLSAIHIGHIARQEVKRRLAMLVTLQMFARRYLMSKRAALRDLKLRNDSAKLMQRVARGYNARRKVSVLKVEKEERDKLKERNAVPMYYRVYERYLQEQFLFHRPMILRLQCFFRVRKALRRTIMLRRICATKKIQYAFRRHLQVKRAKAALGRKRQEKIYRNECGTYINKVVRGFLGRRYVAKIHYADTIKWLLDQIRSKGLASRVFDSFRMRKRNMARAIAAATVLQGLVRGRAGRNHFRYNHKRLVKERRLRTLRKRNKAARNIQALYHIMLAKKIACVKRKERKEQDEQLRLQEDLENRIEGIHGEHMMGLMTTRMQTGARVKLARKTKKQLAAEKKREAELKAEQLRYDSSVKIQALSRGVYAREVFAKNLQQLKKERQARNFCVECESQVATKKCRQCRDRFCDSCFEILHRTGVRRRHQYELVGPAALVTDKMAGIPASNPLLWEECYDEVAQGRYWYNKQTGEASWICPY